MAVQTTSLPIDDGKKLKLVKQNLDFSSVRIQMILGSVLVVAACVINFWPTLHVGLLLDDFNHVEYVHRAVHGDWHDFLLNFYSNWAKLDVMKSYRPVVSVSFLTDYLLWGLNYEGYHFTNILLLAGCALLVSFIALEITGIYGNRSRASVAVWAGLLFAVYPLHVESVSWIIGRVDLLCSFFYYASVWCFLRYRMIRERRYIILSLLFFSIALASKEMAVTLPLVQLFIALLPVGNSGQANQSWRKRIGCSDLKISLLFWLELAAFSLVRNVFLGATIGGYGSTDPATVLHSLRNFADRATLYKIIIPLNEELHLNQLFLALAGCATAVVGGLALLRLTISRKLLVPLALLLAWTVLAILPTFQIWHIFPNLVGSRLFFTSSAPWCIGLAVCAIPSIDAISRTAARVYTALGTLALFVLYGSWSMILQENLKPWLTAASQMQKFERQLRETDSHAAGKRILLLNLSPDYQGAGMVTRAWYLQQLCRPPFTSKDISDTFVSVEPVISGSHDFIWPGEVLSLLNGSVAQTLIWDAKGGRFLPFNKSDSGSSIPVVLNNFLSAYIDPPTAWSGASSQWHLESDDQPGLEQYPNFRRLYPAKTSKQKRHAPPVMTFWIDVNNINPLNINFAKPHINIHGNDADLSKCSFVWKSSGLNPPDQLEHEAKIVKDKNNGYFVWLGRYRSWTLNNPPSALGLRLRPGEYCVDLKDIELIPDKSLKVVLLINSRPALPGTVIRIPHSKVGQDAISWTAKIPGCNQVIVKVSQPNLTFEANEEGQILNGPTGNLARELARPGTAGSIPLSQLSLQQGTTQIQVIAKDKSGDTIGLPSEPISIKVE